MSTISTQQQSAQQHDVNISSIVSSSSSFPVLHSYERQSTLLLHIISQFSAQLQQQHFINHSSSNTSNVSSASSSASSFPSPSSPPPPFSYHGKLLTLVSALGKKIQSSHRYSASPPSTNPHINTTTTTATIGHTTFNNSLPDIFLFDGADDNVNTFGVGQDTVPSSTLTQPSLISSTSTLSATLNRPSHHGHTLSISNNQNQIVSSNPHHQHSISMSSSNSQMSDLMSPAPNSSPVSISSSLSPISPAKTLSTSSMENSKMSAKFSSTTSSAPIVDVCVCYGRSPACVPSGYYYISRTLNGASTAVLGGKKVYICYRRSTQPMNQQVFSKGGAFNFSSSATTGINNSSISSLTSPLQGHNSLPNITSISVILLDCHEEAPYGFDLIERTYDGKPANLNPNKRLSSTNQQHATVHAVYLAVFRGEGAPINQLAVTQQSRSSTTSHSSSSRIDIPSGYHVIRHTPFAHLAELQSGGTSDSSLFLICRPNPQPVIFNYFSHLYHHSLTLISPFPSFAIQLTSILTAALYSADANLIATSLQLFKQMHSSNTLAKQKSNSTVSTLTNSHNQQTNNGNYNTVALPASVSASSPHPLISPTTLNAFVSCLCDATPLFLTYFTTSSHTLILKFLLYIIRSSISQLSLNTILKILESCFLARHEDKHTDTSLYIIQIISKTLQKYTCSNTKKHKKKISDHNVAINNHNISSASLQSRSQSNSPPSTTNSSSSSSSSNSSLLSSHNFLCLSCRWSASVSKLSSFSYCQALLNRSIRYIVIAKRLEPHVKTFQRHTSTGPQFRSDVNTLALLLEEEEEEEEKNIENLKRLAETENITTNSATNNVINAVASTPNSNINHSIYASSDLNYPFPASSRAFYAVVLILCKFATENAAFNLKKSEVVKRKVHGLRLLLHLLQHSTDYCGYSLSSIFLIRRFVCPSLMTACITDVPVVFRLVLSIFTHLYETSFNDLVLELGVLLDQIFLSLLESAYTTIAQKRDIIDVLHHCLKTPRQLVDLFYNYDNHLTQWKIFERLILILAKLCQPEEGSYTSSSVATNSNKYNQNNNNYNSISTSLIITSNGTLKQRSLSHTQADNISSSLTTSSNASSTSPSNNSSSSSTLPADGDIDSAGEDDSVEGLRKHAIRLLIHLLHLQAQWLGIPGIKSSSSLNQIEDENPLAPNTIAEEEELEKVKDQESENSGVNSPKKKSKEDGEEEVEDGLKNKNRQFVDIQISNTSVVNTPPSNKNMDPSNTLSVPSSALPLSDVNAALSIQNRLLQHINKSSTWTRRVTQQKADAAVVRHALKLARSEKLRSAVAYLKMVSPAAAIPAELAHFLFENDGLDKAEVGDLLSGSSDSLLSHSEYESLRYHYLSLLDFTGMTFDSALRSYLCDSGFRLPGEAQKIDRMLEAFCEAYCRDNSGTFRTSTSAFVVAFALVLLNTDLHDPRLKQGSTSRKPMTLQGFISNLRGVDDGHDFPPTFLTHLYHSIQQQPIEWKDNNNDNNNSSDQAGSTVTHRSTSSSLQTPSSSSLSSLSHSRSPSSSFSSSSLVGLSIDISAGALSSSANRKAARKFFEVLVRKSLAYLKNHAHIKRTIYSTDDPHIVQGMFEVSWFRCIAAITVVSETSNDIAVLHMCLDGLAYGSCIAIALRTSMERQAFTRVLAKLTFVEKYTGTFAQHSSSAIAAANDDTTLTSEIEAGSILSAANSINSASNLTSSTSLSSTIALSRRIIDGEHLKQEWYRRLNLTSEKHPARACKMILRVCLDTKARVSAERRTLVIRKVQSEFGNELSLVVPGRSLLLEGDLTKLNSTGKKVIYHVFLFTDLLIYASSALQHKYKCHRTIHLSLCRLEDIKQKNLFSFRVVSPQKVVVLCSFSENVKQQWIDTLLLQMQRLSSRRRAYIQQTIKLTQALQYKANSIKPKGSLAHQQSISSLNDSSDPPSIQPTFIPSLSETNSFPRQQHDENGKLFNHQPPTLRILSMPIESSSDPQTHPSSPHSTSISNFSQSPADSPELEWRPTELLSQYSNINPKSKTLTVNANTSTTLTGNATTLKGNPMDQSSQTFKSPSRPSRSYSSNTAATSTFTPTSKANEIEFTLGNSSSATNSSTSASASSSSSTTPAVSLLGVSASPLHCKMCLRSFTLFRRRLTCPICTQPVCKECTQTQLQIKENYKQNKKLQKQQQQQQQELEKQIQQNSSPDTETSNNSYHNLAINQSSLSLNSSNSMTNNNTIGSPDSFLQLPTLDNQLSYSSTLDIGRVCDACAGVLSEIVDDTTPLLIQTEK